MSFDWGEAMDMLATERRQYGNDPNRFPILLGIDDIAAMTTWITEDAAESVQHLGKMTAAAFEAGQAPPIALSSAVATMIATHSQMYLELGLWLAQTGRVRP